MQVGTVLLRNSGDALLLRLVGVWGEDVWRAGWVEGVARGGAGRGLGGRA